METWQEVGSYPEIEASSLGRVRLKPKVAKTPTGGTRTYVGRPSFGFEEKCATARAGSPRRRIIRIGRLRRTFKVHQLVCEAFHGPKPFDDALVLHLDEDPSNNRPENLRWGTHKENQNAPRALAAFRARAGENSAWAIHYRRKHQ